MRTNSNSTVTLEVTVTLTEMEVRALDAMVGYGVEPFLETFYKMGRHYMEPYEAGIRSIFKTIEKEVRPEIGKVDRMRRLYEEDIKTR